MKNITIASALLSAFVLGGCSFHARGPDQYREDTRAVLETRSDQIRSCYDSLLKEDKKAEGRIILTFTVQKETGEFTDVTIQDDGSSDSPELRKCVLDAVAGLKLEPVDKRDGKATFTYEFKQN